MRGHLPYLALRVIVHVPVVSGHTTGWGAEHEDVNCVCHEWGRITRECESSYIVMGSFGRQLARVNVLWRDEVKFGAI